MDHFGIDFEQGTHVLADGLDLPIQDGQIVLFTGPSGSGKSSLMRAVAAQLADLRTAQDSSRPQARSLGGNVGAGSRSVHSRSGIVHTETVSLPERILVEAIDWPVDDTLQLLAACGLGEAQLLLRTPSELSDGQRYRFRLAFALSLRPRWIVADEFTATLDRTLARVVAFNVRRLADRSGTGFLLATTHEDVTCDLAPDLHIQCSLNGQATVTSSGSAQVPPVSDVPCARPLKKKASVVRKSSGSVPQPSPTGRTSLGGITGATRSA